VCLCLIFGCRSPIDPEASDTSRADASRVVVPDAARDSAPPLDPLALPIIGPDGQPLDVGLLVLGHSTSLQGDWPGKLALAREAIGDPRRYVVFQASTPSDGGFLWTIESAAPGDRAYARFLASPVNQYCEDAAARRWSCRRTRLVRLLSGREPAPPECDAEASGCAPARIATCVWHDAEGEHRAPDVDAHECWTRMDVRIALVQDTTNRSWPLGDYDGDGDVDDDDMWPVARVRDMAGACPEGGGEIDGLVDFDCSGSLDADDAPVRNYTAWLRALALDLLDGFAGDGVDYVYLSHKPVERGCVGSGACDPHAIRAPTPSAPFDHHFSSAVYWEYRALEDLFVDPSLDPRIRPASADVRAMWDASARCYATGWSEWMIDVSAGRPVAIEADDIEDDMEDSASVGCMLADHIHHNDAGGWLMADVWYRGLAEILRF
jgi:hypothetical protein